MNLGQRAMVKVKDPPLQIDPVRFTGLGLDKAGITSKRRLARLRRWWKRSVVAVEGRCHDRLLCVKINTSRRASRPAAWHVIRTECGRLAGFNTAVIGLSGRRSRHGASRAVASQLDGKPVVFAVFDIEARLVQNSVQSV